LVTGIIIWEQVYHELTLKIETTPSFPVEIYISRFIIIVIMMMILSILKIESLFGDNG